MSFLAWMGLAGVLLLLMALSSAYLRRLPITTSAIYLAIGVAISPIGFGLLEVNFIEWSLWFEHLTEIAVIVSLFLGGLKLRLPLSNSAWMAAFRLAGPVMIVSIGGVAAFSHYFIGLNWPFALLLGAVLAPTDPVLASAVSVNHAADGDRMRYGLSGEAGFNDGAAFPFVAFAVLWIEYDRLGGWIGEWALHRLVWAIPVGLMLGYFVGKGVGRLAFWIRTHYKETSAPNDFLALSLIALSYVGAEYVGAWGFLSVFAAGLGFRRAEVQTVLENPLPDHEVIEQTGDPGDPSFTDHPPAELLTSSALTEEDVKEPAQAAGVVVSDIISFGGTVDRLLEVMLIILVGLCLAVYWDWRAVPLSLALFMVIRPAAVFVFLIGTPTSRIQRVLMGWFGIRGIGSLYYLSYALNHGAQANAADVTGLTLSVVALSILFHGISSQPILDHYERTIAADKS
jgi:sodium/hydrogen antiporter